MRGDVAYRVYGVHEGREEDTYIGAFRTEHEAKAEIDQLEAKEMLGRNWAEQYHNRGFVIREAIIETEFELPPRPKPRDRYVIKASARPGPSTVVEVFRRNGTADEVEKVCHYERNYRMLRTFEPFRQSGRDFALISMNYTKTAVLDLASGDVIAEEGEGPPDEAGFCPAGFYVPDWWDVHGGSTIPGSEHWTKGHEWPTGDFGFVWGCYWGDDSSWKVQYLDLSHVQQGVIKRDVRFGYVELATAGSSMLPLLSETSPEAGAPPHFIRVSNCNGIAKVEFAVEMRFDVASGKAEEWQRLRIANME